MGCFPTAAPKVAPPLNSKSSLSARESLKKSAGFRAFISHMKLEGAMEARFLQTELESHLKEHCFLDSDDLRSLHKLCDHVKESKCIVLLQTRSVLTRPYCLLELLTAIENRVPIVGVSVTGRDAAYDYAEAANLLTWLDEELDAVNPGAADVLREHGHTDLTEAAYNLSHLIPKIISVQLNCGASRHILAATIKDVAEAMNEATALPLPPPDEKEKWLAARVRQPRPQRQHGDVATTSSTTLVEPCRRARRRRAGARRLAARRPRVLRGSQGEEGAAAHRLPAAGVVSIGGGRGICEAFAAPLGGRRPRRLHRVARASDPPRPGARGAARAAAAHRRRPRARRVGARAAPIPYPGAAEELLAVGVEPRACVKELRLPPAEDGGTDDLSIFDRAAGGATEGEAAEAAAAVVEVKRLREQLDALRAEQAAAAAQQQQQRLVEMQNEISDGASGAAARDDVRPADAAVHDRIPAGVGRGRAPHRHRGPRPRDDGVADPADRPGAVQSYAVAADRAHHARGRIHLIGGSDAHARGAFKVGGGDEVVTISDFNEKELKTFESAC